MRRESFQTNPTYFDYDTEEFRGNPLPSIIFPKWETEAELSARLSRMPAFNKKERDLPASLRSGCCTRVRNFNFPTTAQKTIAPLLRLQVMNAYSGRNPMTQPGQLYLYNAHKHGFSLNQIDHTFSLPQISTLIGIPGVGKTSALWAVLNTIGPTVTQHQNYKGNPFNELQILYIVYTLSSKPTLKAITVGIREYADELVSLATSEEVKLNRLVGSRGDVVAGLKTIFAGHHTALLVIDGVEDISLAGTSGLGELSSSIRELQQIGVSVLLVGTYAAEDRIMADPSVAQRCCDGFHARFEHYKSAEDPDYISFTNVMEIFRWIKHPFSMSDLRETLYDCSQGVTRVFLDLYMVSQILAIDSGKEELNPDYIRKVYKDHFKPVHRSINALRKGTEEALRQFEGFFPKAYTDLERTGVLGNAMQAAQQAIIRQYAQGPRTEISSERKSASDSSSRSVPSPATELDPVLSVDGLPKELK